MIVAHQLRTHTGVSAVSSCDYDTQAVLEGGGELSRRFLTMISADYLNGNDAECRDIEQMFLTPENFEMFCAFVGINPDRAKATLFAMRPDRSPHRWALGLRE